MQVYDILILVLQSNAFCQLSNVYLTLFPIYKNKLSNRTKTGIGCTTFMKNNSNHPKAPRSSNAIVYEQGDNYYSECNVMYYNLTIL